MPALDYLIASNRKGLGDDVPDFDTGALNAEGKHVVVIGGGDTAMDCVRTAVRQGATSVTCLYRRDRANMPGSQREVKPTPRKKACEFEWLAAPEAFLGEGTRAAACARSACISACPTPPAASRPEPIAGADFDLPGRPGHQGAGLRSRGPAGAFDEPGAGGHAAGAR